MTRNKLKVNISEETRDEVQYVSTSLEMKMIDVVAIAISEYWTEDRINQYNKNKFYDGDDE